MAANADDRSMVGDNFTTCPVDHPGRREPEGLGIVRTRLISWIALIAVVTAATVTWIYHAAMVNHWLAVHTGTVNEPGPYYAFWSGFGSDVTEFGIIGAVGTGVYQLARKYNCHETRCWRIGNHSAVDGQFHLCYRHHPDFQGSRPTRDMIVSQHREHRQREALLIDRLHQISQHLATGSSADHQRRADGASDSPLRQPRPEVNQSRSEPAIEFGSE